MLPKKHRLNLKHSFQKIRTTGKRAFDDSLSIFWLYDEQTLNWQANVAVPTRVTKIKPVRNRIQRLIMQSLRVNQNKYQNNLQLIILVNKDLSKMKQDEINTKLNAILTKTKIIK